MKNFSGSVENGLTRAEFSKVIRFVQSRIFDGCPSRVQRSFYLIEHGKIVNAGPMPYCRSYRVFYSYKKICPITNLDRIVDAIIAGTSKNSDFRYNRNNLKEAIQTYIRH